MSYRLLLGGGSLDSGLAARLVDGITAGFAPPSDDGKPPPRSRG